MNKINVEDKIDLTAIVKSLWNERKLYIIPLSVAMIAGAIIALSIPNTYKSQVILAPELSNNSTTDKISGLASMVGLNLGNFNTSVDAFYPTIYPDVIKSTPFVLDLFSINVTSHDGKLKDITLYDYITKHQRSSLLSYPLSWFKSSAKDDKKQATNTKNSVVKLTKLQDKVKKAINGMVSCQVDKRTDIITISVTTQDPLISAILADTVTHRLQQYIVKYRTKKAKNDLDYAILLQQEAKRQFDDIQQQYTSFVDRHLDMAFETTRQKAKDLENGMNFKYQMYTQVSQQVQLAKAKVQERTPSFSEIEPAVVPIKKDGPARTLIVLGFMLIAAIGTSIRILAKK